MIKKASLILIGGICFALSGCAAAQSGGNVQTTQEAAAENAKTAGAAEGTTATAAISDSEGMKLKHRYAGKNEAATLLLAGF